MKSQEQKHQNMQFCTLLKTRNHLQRFQRKENLPQVIEALENQPKGIPKILERVGEQGKTLGRKADIMERDNEAMPKKPPNEEKPWKTVSKTLPNEIHRKKNIITILLRYRTWEEHRQGIVGIYQTTNENQNITIHQHDATPRILTPAEEEEQKLLEDKSKDGMGNAVC